MSNQYRGHLDRNPDGTVSIWIEDEWAWRITLRGVKDPAGGYVLTGELGAPPAALRIPLIDEA